MTTVEDTQEIQNSVDVTNDGAIRQEFEYVNPIVVTPITGEVSTSHDKATNDFKQETIQSYYSKWRLYHNYVIETSTDGLIDIFPARLYDFWYHNDLGNPSFGGATMGTYNFSSRSYAGVRFDVDYKFTIYSSSQQQGALYFAYSPGLTDTKIRMNSAESILDMQHGAVFSSDNLGLTEPTMAESYLQFPYKVVSFGGETEVLMKIPYLMKYDFVSPRMIPDTLCWGQIFVGVLSPLVVREGTYDKIMMRVDISFSNVEFIGPNFATGGKSMGTYDFGQSFSIN